ncbi:MAG: 16S rRNA (cytosine(967)-C(5))-methyltransferase RsmB, partial [Acutalibacteraceae bacterium]|nr:16S rRNA (cytosine(967)-C(5))-methyltransferase RsmB [Acutalibacteraceae bacterium]
MAEGRKIVLDALLRVEEDGAYSNITLNSIFKNEKIGKTEKAFVSALFYGVLDRKITLDFYINKLSKIKVKKLEPITRQALRMGIYQLYFMEKVPVSAAVNESVELVKNSVEGKNCGFVNAVLRAAANEKIPLPTGSDLYSLSVRYSCPVFILSELINDYGTEKTQEIIKAYLLPSKVRLRVNILKTTAKQLFDSFSKAGILLEKTEDADCFTAIEGIDFGNNKFFSDGLFYIQDKSSADCALSLNAKAGERVLDVCAAPGGKSFTVAMSMINQGEIVSCDLYENRVKLIEASAKRLSISCIKPTVNDATVFNSRLGCFDAVLCDVPCSGFGVIRRKPEIKYKPINNFDELEEIQYKILTTSSLYVKNGGRLLYSTCTLRKAENEKIVEKFLDENDGFCCEYMHTDFPCDKNDGFFRAMLRLTRVE